MLNDKVILITGGTGSFGGKFTEAVFKKYKPKKIIVFSRDEFKQYQMSKVFPIAYIVLLFLSTNPASRYSIISSPHAASLWDLAFASMSTNLRLYSSLNFMWNSYGLTLPGVPLA